MRKLSEKWPLRLILFAFVPPIFYVFFRIGKPELFGVTERNTELAQMIIGAICISIIVWVVYGIACLCARTWVNCGTCKFSDAIQDSKEITCRLTGYNYPITYFCKKSKPKETEGAKNSNTANR